MPSQAVRTNAFRIKAATWAKSLPTYLAWGTGNVGWGSNPPAPTPADTDLVAEIGRKKVLANSFVVPDNAGEIILRTGTRWSPSLVPTRWIYHYVVFEPEEAAGQTIREWGLFVDGTTQVGLPGGQLYFTPGQVTSKGTLAIVQREVYVRSAFTKELFQLVQAF